MGDPQNSMATRYVYTLFWLGLLGLLSGLVLFCIWKCRGGGKKLLSTAWDTAREKRPDGDGVRLNELQIAVFKCYSEVGMLGPNLTCPPPTEQELQKIINRALGATQTNIEDEIASEKVMKFVMTQLLFRAIATAIVVPVCGTLGSVTWNALTGWLWHLTADVEVNWVLLCIGAFIYDQHTLNMQEPLGGLIFMGIFIVLFLCPNCFAKTPWVYFAADKLALWHVVVRGCCNDVWEQNSIDTPALRVPLLRKPAAGVTYCHPLLRWMTRCGDCWRAFVPKQPTPNVVESVATAAPPQPTAAAAASSTPRPRRMRALQSVSRSSPGGRAGPSRAP